MKLLKILRMMIAAVKERAELLGVNWMVICSVTDVRSPLKRENCDPFRGRIRWSGGSEG